MAFLVGVLFFLLPPASVQGITIDAQWGESGDVPMPGDYDGDEKTDIAVWRPSDGNWYIVRSSDGGMTGYPWGSAGDIPVPGDYDGDGKTDYAVWRPSDGNWYIVRSSDGGMTGTPWGTSGDVPVPGDYDGDGKTDCAIWRPGDGTWWVLRSLDGGITGTQWGSNALNDVVVPGDYDGDGKTDYAVWRLGDGRWWVLRSSDGGITGTQWGSNASNDVVVPGDYGGDGKTDYAIWRPGDGTWWVLRSSDGGITGTQWGSSALNDVVVPGDYDGDGKTDVAVWRPSSGVWYILTSSDLMLTGYGNLRLADHSDGSKNYSFNIELQNPDGSTLTEKNRIQDVKVYSYPSLTEVPQSTPWSLWYSLYFNFDNGTDPNPPYSNPWSEAQSFLNVSMGTLPAGFYKGVVTDDASGRQHEVWLYYDTPTEVSKVQASSMGVTPNPDGSATLSWTNPTLDPAKHIIRLRVFSDIDYSGDGYDDALLLVSLPPTSNNYTIPAAEVTRLKGYSGLYWYVQIREIVYNVVNPDATTKTYFTYRNYGQHQALSLP